VSLVVGLVTTLPATATAAPLAPPPKQGDDRGGPLQEKARALRQEAVAQVLNGQATVQEKNGSKVVKLAGAGKDQYVELSRERTDRVFVVLAEFGNQRHPKFPDQDTNKDVPGPQRFGGPKHNQIAKPGQNDNSTIWRKDFSQKYFDRLYFGKKESVRTYFETQSSGRYSIAGKVTDWVKVPYNEARYGRSDGYPCDEIVCPNSEQLAVDAMNVWAAGQRAKGLTQKQIRAELAKFDQWDRYDGDQDGNFNEPDGYIDHLQIVHAGSDQATEDPVQGEDAIWSHFGIIQFQGVVGQDGPKGHEYGGAQIGKTGMWIDQYTVQAENAGLAVIAHEYGHDLGLPDDYQEAAGRGRGPAPEEGHPRGAAPAVREAGLVGWRRARPEQHPDPHGRDPFRSREADVPRPVGDRGLWRKAL
jgi:immune inhibitor A